MNKDKYIIIYQIISKQNYYTFKNKIIFKNLMTT